MEGETPELLVLVVLVAVPMLRQTQLLWHCQQQSHKKIQGYCRAIAHHEMWQKFALSQS